MDKTTLILEAQLFLVEKKAYLWHIHFWVSCVVYNINNFTCT